MSETPVIAITNLSVAIEGRPILQDVSFSVLTGEYLSILGPNGAGKTTLLKCLNRIVSDCTGDLFLSGRPLRRIPQKELARQLGYVPQLRDTLLPFTVREFALMSRYPFLSPFAPPGTRDHEAVEMALALTGMQAFAERPLATLSGGECQKASIAAALAQEAPVLLLDEPTTFLDPRYQGEIGRLLRRLNRERGTTVVVVTHDINSAVLHSDRVLALKNGRVAFCGRALDIMKPDVLSTVFDSAFTFAQHPTVRIPMLVPEP